MQAATVVVSGRPCDRRRREARASATKSCSMWRWLRDEACWLPLDAMEAVTSRTCLLQPATAGWGASLIRCHGTAKERLAQVSRQLGRHAHVSRSRALLQHLEQNNIYHYKPAPRCSNGRLPAQQNTKGCPPYALAPQHISMYRGWNNAWCLFFDFPKLGAELKAHRIAFLFGKVKVN